MHVNENIKVGPGLARVNSILLDDPLKLAAIFGHYSGSNSRSNSGPIFDSTSSRIPIFASLNTQKIFESTAHFECQAKSALPKF